ncbi:ubiquitin-like protein Pup [Propionibacteriaceae bacterium G1746]|uniref:ubiquitin-like protein Pup n=1 Tax=Aestuariimicrobium sp. G57 TaxID=3418485 RepID=UPI003C168BC3
MANEQQFEQRRGQHRADDDILLSATPQGQSQQQGASIDDLLDQIDAVIERNPEGYVRSFVQRGGQ